MELDENNQLIDKYIRGKQLIKSDLNGYYLHNGHGDIIQLADQQGNVTTSYLYDAFGIEQETQPTDPNPFRYCGEYLDNESGNVYLRARYYDPSIGPRTAHSPILLIALSNKGLKLAGYLSLMECYSAKLHVNFGTAVYRTVRTVVWEVGCSTNGQPLTRLL